MTCLNSKAKICWCFVVLHWIYLSFPISSLKLNDKFKRKVNQNYCSRNLVAVPQDVVGTYAPLEIWIWDIGCEQSKYQPWVADVVFVLLNSKFEDFYLFAELITVWIDAVLRMPANNWLCELILCCVAMFTEMFHCRRWIVYCWLFFVIFGVANSSLHLFSPPPPQLSTVSCLHCLDAKPPPALRHDMLPSTACLSPQPDSPPSPLLRHLSPRPDATPLRPSAAVERWWWGVWPGERQWRGALRREAAEEAWPWREAVKGSMVVKRGRMGIYAWREAMLPSAKLAPLRSPSPRLLSSELPVEVSLHDHASPPSPRSLTKLPSPGQGYLLQLHCFLKEITAGRWSKRRAANGQGS